LHLLGEKRKGAGSTTKKTSPLEMKIYNDYLSIKKNRNEKIKICYNNEFIINRS